MTQLRATHDLHKRRLSRNVGVGVTLLAMVAVVFGLTMVKVTRGDPMERFDHVSRPALEAAAEDNQ